MVRPIRGRCPLDPNPARSSAQTLLALPREAFDCIRVIYSWMSEAISYCRQNAFTIKLNNPACGEL